MARWAAAHPLLAAGALALGAACVVATGLCFGIVEGAVMGGALSGSLYGLACNYGIESDCSADKAIEQIAMGAELGGFGALAGAAVEAWRGAGMAAEAADAADGASAATRAGTIEQDAQGAARTIDRLPQDARVNPQALKLKPLNRPIGQSDTQNRALQDRFAELREQGADEFRVNQQQVDVNGLRAGTNRPDLQYTLKGRRYYEEWDTKTSGRGPGHKTRILSNDPWGVVMLWIVN